MIPIEPPKANPENLLDIIKAAYDAKVVLPEFQRSFVWGREDIEEFLTSVFEGYFVGTFLLLDTPTNGAIFPLRVVEGLQTVNNRARAEDHPTVRLVLDGQQRISSVFYALYEPEIPLRSSKYPYRFFLQLDPALQGDLDEAVVGISAWDRRRMSEIKSLIRDHRAVPLSLLRDSGRFYDWLYEEQTRWNERAEKKQIAAFCERLHKFMVPVVSLSADVGKDNIVSIFERINRTGITLSLFDLLVARLYVKDIKLRNLWQDFEKRHRELAEKVLSPESVLKVIALLEGKEPRKRTLLDMLDSLKVDRFNQRWEEATAALVTAYERMRREYGAFDPKWIPYTTVIVPLAAMLCELQREGANAEAFRRLDRWYWVNVLAQRYDSAVDSKSAQDFREVLPWVRGGKEPEWLTRAAAQGPELAVDEPRSAVYRGVMCLIVRRGARDFLTGQTAPLHKCNDDHMFPKSLYRKQTMIDTVLNRSLIWEDTNKKRKSDKRPAEFLAECLQGHGGDEERLLKTLDSHFIDRRAYKALKANDFDQFVSARRDALSKAVTEVLGV